MKPLAITGTGVVSPVALDWAGFRAALEEPRQARARAFEPGTALPLDKLPEAKVAEVQGFDANALLGDKGHRNFDRLTKHLIVAAKRALEMAGLKKDGQFVSAKLGPEQIGICSSTAYGSLDAITELNLVAELEDPRYINPARFPNTVINAAAGYVSIWEDLRAPNATVVDGNCGSLDAVLTCETHLAHRRADAFLVGGGDVLSEPLYVAFRRIGALAEGNACWEPGSPESTGLHLGEGSAYFVVERRNEAEARGANIQAVITGYGTAFEPPTNEAFLLNPTPVAVSRAIRLALDDAGVPPSRVDAVVSSLGGFVKYDAAELHGIETVFGSDVAIVTPKSIWGECFAGSAALGMAAGVAFVSGTPLGPLFAGTDRPAKTVVVTAVGYYGNVSAVVLRAA